MPDSAVSSEMRQRILSELEAIEVQRGVRILFAVESGSRAWGFPSTDSDWDVRFVFARSAASYLSVAERRDVIERPIDEALDIGGWDVRKALGLLTRSNAPLLEWLASPIRYRDDDRSAGRMLSLAREICSLPALAYHYDRLARRSLDEIARSEGAIRLKAYCYVMRPALTLAWMARHAALPPMDLPSLRAGLSLTAAQDRAIDELVDRKAVAGEADRIGRLSVLDELFAQCLAETAPRVANVASAVAIARADRVFASLIGWPASAPP